MNIRPFPFILLIALLGLGHRLEAQTSLFEPARCGCDISNPNQEVNYPELVKSFPNNTIAASIIDGFRLANDQPSLQQAINRLRINLKDAKVSKEKPDFIEKIVSVYDSASSVGKESLAARALVCTFAGNLHQHYLGAAVDTSTAAPAEFTSETEQPVGEIPYFWISMLLISLGLNGWLWFQSTRSKHQSPKNEEEMNSKIQQILEEKGKEIQLLQEEVALKNRQIEQLKQSNKILQDELAFLSAQLENQPTATANSQPNPTQTNTATPPAAEKSSFTAAGAIIKYLYAPTRDGVFLDKAVQPQKDSNAFYAMRLLNEQDSSPEFTLLPENEIIRRAEHLGLEPLLSVCELQGKGRIPQDVAAISIERGRLRKEGVGWRVDKKIVLRW